MVVFGWLFWSVVYEIFLGKPRPGFYLGIPSYVNGQGIGFISNGFQGIRISSLFLEKKSLVCEKFVLKQVRSKFLRTFFKPSF